MGGKWKPSLTPKKLWCKCSQLKKAITKKGKSRKNRVTSRPGIKKASAFEYSAELDLEVGLLETKVHLSKTEKDCKICHPSLDATNLESGLLIELGCSCKSDLAAAHKQCVEA